MIGIRMNFGDALLLCAGIVMVVVLVLAHASVWLYVAAFVALVMAFIGGMHADEPR
ncbi:hypothetical protein [Lacticaseibacillus sp. N501-2]|uniref:hypothetical protein n=1 Tax=Lacticaseibacillus salsurae TaxID=3367729 RepID=UPI0038B33BEB